jgi:hypothetical protein
MDNFQKTSKLFNKKIFAALLLGVLMFGIGVYFTQEQSNLEPDLVQLKNDQISHDIESNRLVYLAEKDQNFLSLDDEATSLPSPLSL